MKKKELTEGLEEEKEQYLILVETKSKGFIVTVSNNLEKIEKLESYLFRLVDQNAIDNLLDQIPLTRRYAVKSNIPYLSGSYITYPHRGYIVCVLMIDPKRTIKEFISERVNCSFNELIGDVKNEKSLEFDWPFYAN